MNKKGIAPATLVTLVIAVAVIIGVGIFLARASAEAKTEGFNLPYGKIPEKTPSLDGGSTLGTPPTTPALETEFVDAIETAVASDKEICRVELSAYPGLDDLNVIMKKNGDNLEVDVQRRSGAPVMLEEFENYAPCIVHGRNFYEWLWNGDMNAKNNQYIIKEEIFIIGGGGEGVAFTPPDAEGKTKRDLKGERPLIYKYKKNAASKGYICIIHTFEDGSWPFVNNNCNIDSNDRRNAVDSDCILIRGSSDWLEVLGRTPIC